MHATTRQVVCKEENVVRQIRKRIVNNCTRRVADVYGGMNIISHDNEHGVCLRVFCQVFWYGFALNS